MSKRKRSIVYTTEDENGETASVVIPMRYGYAFLAAALIGMFTVAGLAGSYTRMLAKTENFNKLRQDLASTRSNYAHLEKKNHEKDVQVASLSSLASEVSAIYGLTAGRLTLPRNRAAAARKAVADAKSAPLKDDSLGLSDDSYYKSLDTFYALRNTATDQTLSRSLDTNLGQGGSLATFAGLDIGGTPGLNTPDMWPILGPINSSFGQREDPVLGMGAGEFHKGVDIGAPDGTPVHAPAAGRVLKAAMGTGYGREIEIDHGNGIVTVYGHLSGWNVVAGQQVVKGQVIGYTGHSGKTTGHHLHYEVQVHGAAVNPHKYLQTTMAQLGGGTFH